MLKPGDTIERYTIEAVIGQGGMGCVYRAHDTRLDRRVALKVLLADERADDTNRSEAKARLLREARLAAALDHPNAVAIYDVGEVDSTPFIAMELVAGRTVRDSIGDSAVPIKERIGWLLDMARALSAAHRAGLVHRDVKPENVMVRPDGRVKVLDFGIARRASVAVDPSAPTQAPALETLTAKGIQVGTPMYMAPEQIRGDRVDGRADQFAWGIVAYELLTGKVPWKSHDALSLVASLLTEQPKSLRQVAPQVPPDIDAAVLRTLSKAPTDRFPSMDEVVRILEPHVSGAPAPAKDALSEPSAPGATDLRRYSTGELEQILQRALEREQERDGKFSHNDLIEAAREVGIDEKALRLASRELASPVVPAELESPAVWRERERRKLMRHAAMFFVMNIFFFLLDMVTAGGRWWYFVFLGWGMGLGAHAVKYFFPVDLTPRVSKRKEKRARDRRHDLGRAATAGSREQDIGSAFREADVEAGVSLLLRATAKRARVAVPPAARARVAPLDELAEEPESERAGRGRQRAR